VSVSRAARLARRIERDGPIPLAEFMALNNAPYRSGPQTDKTPTNESPVRNPSYPSGDAPAGVAWRTTFLPPTGVDPLQPGLPIVMTIGLA